MFRLLCLYGFGVRHDHTALQTEQDEATQRARLLFCYIIHISSSFHRSGLPPVPIHHDSLRGLHTTPARMRKQVIAKIRLDYTAAWAIFIC
jgi:hypothetical protein